MNKMFKRFLAVFLTSVMIFGAAPIGALLDADFKLLKWLKSPFGVEAQAVTFDGTCGDNINWTLDTDTGVLSITGTGEMWGYNSSSTAPWYAHSDTITTVTIADGVSFVFCL